MLAAGIIEPVEECEIMELLEKIDPRMTLEEIWGLKWAL